MSEEWGPWVENKGVQPVPDGTIVAVEFRRPPKDGEHVFSNPDAAFAETWVWRLDGNVDDIIIYRIRKPRGMAILESLLENLPDEVPA